MANDGKPSSWTTRLFRGSVYLFGAVILLHLSLALIREIWWLLAIVALIVIAVAILRWWHRMRGPWS